MNKIEVIFEDESLIVVNKPTGLVVNISKTSPDSTLQNYLMEKQAFESGDDSEFAQRSGLVHRLDKNTSGIVLAAKDEKTFRQLKKQFKDRRVKKVYLAVVLDHLQDPLITIDAPIKRDPNRRLRMAVVGGGRKAVTKIMLVKNFSLGDLKASLIEINLQTGRTHQIRVHMAAFNHPVMNDETYMTKKQLVDSREEFSRMMLHAWKLGIYHPKLNKELNFDAPLPEEFDKIYSNTSKN